MAFMLSDIGPSLAPVVAILTFLPATLADENGSGDSGTPATTLSQDELRDLGEKIYADRCASCHGDQGQGVDSAYDMPLLGDDSVGQLAKVIADTMPEGEPEECIGQDAEAVAAYIHYSFYSEAAQIRNRPPRIGLARLTANQLRQSIADLYSRFTGDPRPISEQGVQGIYFDGDRWKNDKKKIERVDPVIDFDFGRESPGEGIQAEAFYIYWDGGIRADVTGRYEIIVRSTCSFVFNLGTKNREFINNHVQSGDKTEFRRSIMLTAGRVYPFKIDFVQRKRKTELPPARISLSWVPPGGTEQIIPTQNLVKGSVPAAFPLQALLPPDDRSYGYERGIAINRQWDESTTAAALEFAQIAAQELWPRYRRNHRKEPNENREILRNFLAELVDTAFRGSLSDELRQSYIDRQVDLEDDDLEAIKRVILVSLKSPRFLYPLADQTMSSSQRAANRLALVLLDSLPSDQRLRKAADNNRLESEGQIREHAQRLVHDDRVRAKTRELMMEWLNLSHIGEISKDDDLYAGFDQQLSSDLRWSLDAFVDEVVWSESSDFRQLFQANWYYTTERIAKFYGEPWKTGEEQSRGLVRVGDGTDAKYGLLTHPYLMSGLAYGDSTSPIHRGIFLLRYMLGRTLRPPADAFSPLSPDLHPELTTRQRVELQTSPESCQVCHSKINSLGFVLENYDAVGRYRADENEKPVNVSGGYTSRSSERVEFDGPSDLANYLAGSEDAHRAFVSRAFQHFVKQPPAAYGPDTLERLTQKFADSDFNIRKLIVEIAVLAASRPSKPYQQPSDT